jgi:hypothetical protein
MNYENAWKIIEESNCEDWIQTEVPIGVCETVYKGDLNLRFIDDTSCNEQDFNEEWATRHPDPHAKKHDIKLCYGQSCFASIPVVSVDGGRACLPYPNLETDKISYRDYKVAQIAVLGNSQLDEYIKRSKLTVAKP